MKRFLCAAALAVTTVPALAADVGMSVSIGQPGFYGRIDIGNYPQPQLVYPAPVVVQPVPMAVGMATRPIYLRVPPGHRKHWHKHCYRYDACGQPVYFVEDNWYNNVYAPNYRSYNMQGDDWRGGYDDDHGRGHGHGKGHGKGHGRGHDKD